jgi:CheY-like chemotaxis protein
VIGAFSINDVSGRTFRADEIRIVQTVAQQAALARDCADCVCAAQAGIEALSAGYHLYLTKPVEPVELALVVAHLTAAGA